MIDDGLGLLREHESEGGFWVPDRLVDLCIDVKARRYGPASIYIYCILARALTSSQYPRAYDLKKLSGMPEDVIFLALQELFDLGLINIHDLKAMGLNAEQRDTDDEEHRPPRYDHCSRDTE